MRLFLVTALWALGTFSARAGVDSVPPADPEALGADVESHPFGRTSDGERVTLYTLRNRRGMSVSIMDYGATVTKILAPDRAGKLANVIRGFDSFGAYRGGPALWQGGVLGRYANRIDRAGFTLDKMHYVLPPNNETNSMDDGRRGFDRRMWKMEPIDSDIPAVRFSRLSPDGEEGFPGNLYASVTFSLNDENEMRISYEATTDKPTVVNFTQRLYFNLAGDGKISDHVLTIRADDYTPVDPKLIPTGEIQDVENTPFDFRNPIPIGTHQAPNGDAFEYDHNFVLNKGWFSNWAVAAEVSDPKSGRTLTLSTDQPGLQFCNGPKIANPITMAEGSRAHAFGGFSLEPQHFPDSPNHAHFPSTILRPGETYEASAVYKFGVEPARW